MGLNITLIQQIFIPASLCQTVSCKNKPAHLQQKENICEELIIKY